MSMKTSIVILAVAIASVFGVWLLKTGLHPVPQQAAEPPASTGQELDNGAAQDMMTGVRAQVEHLQELERKDPDNLEILVALGNIYYDAGMAEKAVAYYDRVLAKRPDEVDVIVDKATMVRALGRGREAVELLRHVVQLEPKHEQAWFNMGVILSADLNDTAAAVAAWKKFLEVSPTSPHADAVRQEITRMEQPHAR